MGDAAADAAVRLGVLILRDQNDLRRFRSRSSGEPCVLVPTMGALHEGHASLVRRASELARGLSHGGMVPPVVVSVFVNPTQFNEKADFERYPRDLDKDAALCGGAGATAVFAPAVEVVYPADGTVGVPELPSVATAPGLEDAFRPGHFAGVCQVVKRLFDLAEPRVAVFGEKDWQQLAVVRAMAVSLFPGLMIDGAPTVREPGGLAMSSRNVFLSAEDRERALAISAALCAACAETTPEAAEAAMKRTLGAARIVPEYAVVREAASLGAAREGAPARALIAARVGKVRLIDNCAWGA